MKLEIDRYVAGPEYRNFASLEVVNLVVSSCYEGEHSYHEEPAVTSTCPHTRPYRRTIRTDQPATVATGRDIPRRDKQPGAEADREQSMGGVLGRSQLLRILLTIG